MLKVLDKKGNKWVKVDTVKTDKDGKYDVRSRARPPGSTACVFKGALGLMGSESPAKHL